MSSILRSMLAAILLAGCGVETDVDSSVELGSRKDGIHACLEGAEPYSFCNGRGGVCIYVENGSSNADCRPKCGVGCGTGPEECCIGYGPIDYCNSYNRGCQSAYPPPTAP